MNWPVPSPRESYSRRGWANYVLVGEIACSLVRRRLNLYNRVPLNLMTKSPPGSKLLDVLRKRVSSLIAEGRMEEALRVAQTAADAARRQVSGGDAPARTLVSFLLTLADLQRALDDHAGAERSYLEGLRWSEDAGEPAVFEVARLQAGLASLYDFTGRESEAAPLYAAAIHALDALGADGQLEAAYLHNNLAMILKGEGDFVLAEQHYRAALKAFQVGLGLTSTTVATVLNNLGGLYTFMSRPEEAAEMHQKALEIRQDSDGRNTPDQAQSLSNLAAVFHREGDFARAQRYYEQARHLFERDVRGVEADYAIAMRNFAALYREQGDEAQASATEDAARARLGDRWQE